MTNRAERFLFYLFVVLLPSQLGRHFWPEESFVTGIRIDYLSPTVYCTDILLGIVFVLWIGKKPDRVRYIVYAAVSMAVLAVYNALINPSNSIVPGIVKFISFLEIAFLATYIRTEKPDIRKTGTCLFIASLWSCALAWMQFISQHSIGGLWWFLGERTFSVLTPGIARTFVEGRMILRPYATFSHPNVLGGFLVISFPLVLMSLKIRRVPLWISYGYMAIIFSTVLISLSRSAWIAASGMVLVTCALYGVKKILTAAADHRAMLFGTGAIMLVLFPVIINRFETLLTTDYQSVEHRLQLMSAAQQMIKDHPVIGVGINQFIPQLPLYMSISSAQDLQPVHSMYVLIASETGIPGLGLFLFGFGLLLMHVWRTKKHIPFSIPLLLSLSGIVLVSFFDHYIYTLHQTQLLSGIIIGYAMNLHRRSGTLTL